MTDQKPTEREAVAKHYGGVDHPAGPAIYTRVDMHDAIFDLGRFRELPHERGNRFVDLMCGVKCLVASEVKKRSDREKTPLDVYCFDVALEKLPSEKRAELEAQYRLASGDITEGTGYADGFFDRAAARFGVKNYQPDTQVRILREVRRILAPREGVFVLADMFTTKESYEWSQQERRRKSRHTVGEENAHHHIPTLPMWFHMLRQAGFEPNIGDVYRTKSFVTTTDWVKSKQMNEEGMGDMNDFLLSAPPHAKRDLNIREEEVDGKKVVKIDYPVGVFAATAF